MKKSATRKGLRPIPRRANTNKTKSSQATRTAPKPVSLDKSTLEQLADLITASLRESLEPLQAQLAELSGRLDEVSHRMSQARSVPTAATSARGSNDSTKSSTDAAHVTTTPTESRNDSSCRVPRCPAPVLAKQLCETHYRIMRRTVAAGQTFEPKEQRPARARTASKYCEETDCNEAHYAKGLCRRHYMAARSRIRLVERQSKGAARFDTARDEDTLHEDHEPERLQAEPETSDETFDVGGNGGHDAALSPAAVSGLFRDESPRPRSSSESLPTAEMVARVVAQYRGGLDRVAEVLGRNKRTLIDLLDRLDLMPYVARVREAERQRVESSTLRERLDDLLFREKLLEDLGCLKEVDDRTRFEVKMRCAKLAKTSETIDEALNRLAAEFGLEEAGLKRLIWRYDLRRYLRGLSLKGTAPAARARA